MALKDKTDLKTAANIIRTAKLEGENTAERVGRMFCDIIDWTDESITKEVIDNINSNIKNLQSEISDTNMTLSDHIGNGTHITPQERSLWTTAANYLKSITGSDSDSIINKWDEIVTFLSNYTEADTLSGLLADKADKTQLNDYLPLSSFTGENILDKLLTVDGSGSNLDADTVDGVHNGSLTAMTLRDPNYHDTTHRRTSANINFSDDAGLHTFLATSAMTEGKPGSDGHIIHADWDNSNCFQSQLSLNTNGTVQYRTKKTTGWTSWNTLAFITDNVASASKLDDGTAYTAWGKTFFENGVPQKIEGNLTDVGSISANGELATTSTYALRAKNGGYGLIICNDGKSSSFLLTDKDNQDGKCNLLRPLSINNSTGIVCLGNGLIVNSIQIGNGIITWDFDNDSFRFDRSIYSVGEVTALGAGGDDGGQGSGTGGSLFGLMRSWPGVAPDEGTTEALGANLGWELHEAVKSLQSDVAKGLDTVGLAQYLSDNQYARLSDIPSLPTKLPNPYGLAFTRNGLNVGTYDGSKAVAVDLTVKWGDVQDTPSAFTPSAHTHAIADVTGLQLALDGKSDTGHTHNYLSKYGTDGVLEIAQYIDFHTISNGVIGTEDYTVRLNAGTDTTKRIFTFPTTGGTLATTGSNVASATQLQTSRKIWGQDFNGTGDVSGRWYLSGTANNSLEIFQTDDYRAIQSYNSKPLALNPIGNNVGIGTTAPAYKLDVTGSLRATDLRIGQSPAIEWDAGAEAFKFNAPIYSTGEITALGVGSGTGSGSGGGVSYDRLDAWSDYTSDKSGYVLSAALGYDLYTKKLSTTEAATLYQAKGNYVTTDTVQTISGVKTFSAVTNFGAQVNINCDWMNTTKLAFREGGGDEYGGYIGYGESDKLRLGTRNNTGADIDALQISRGSTNVSVVGNITASSFIRNGGTSSQFLKADGSVDSTAYATTSALNGYLPLTGGMLTGTLNMANGTAVIGVSDGCAIDNVYGYINVMRTLKADTNQAFFSMVNSGTAARCIGLSAGSSIVMGSAAASGKKLSPWLTVAQNSTTAPSYISTVATGTAPISVTSTTVCTNLNADMVDGWQALGMTGKAIKKSGYITTSTSGLSSWWGKLATIVAPYDEDKDVTIYLHSAFNSLYGIVTISLRRNSNNHYARIYLIEGNIAPERIRLYTDTGHTTAELWVDVASQYGVINAIVISETDRAGTETGAYVTMNAQNFATVQTPTYTTYITPTYINRAAKLADNTAFTAWGQTFFENGVPKTVSGDLTGVGKIAATGNITVLGNYDDTVGVTMGIEMCPHNDTANKRVKLLAVAETAWSNRCGLAIYTGRNDIETGERVRINWQGYVGINTASPTQLLDVNGTAKVSKLIIGDCEVTWDSTNSCLKFSKAIVSAGEVTALNG